MSAEYTPGQCNIGGVERRLRYTVGAVSFAVAGAMAVAVVVLSLPAPTALLTALPLFGGFTGLLQGRAGFCAGYAAQGVYNVGDSLGDRHAVPDSAAARADRRRALGLVATAAVAAVLLAVAFFLALTVLVG